MAKKPVKLVCFDIVPEEEKITKRFNFLKDMKEALDATKDVSGNRARELAELAESGEQQLISKFSVSSDGIFCSFLHLKAGAVSLITNDLFSKPSFSFSDIKETNEKGIKGHIKGYTCFLLTDKVFIWKSTRDITTSEISLYINWLLKKALPKYATRNSIISLKQKIKKTFDPLTVKSISIGNDVKIKKESTIETYISPIKESLLNAIKESALRGLDPDAIILDASVILKIQKPRKTDPDEGRRVIQSVLNAVKSDDTILTDKNGNQIKENSVKEAKEVRVTYITDNFLDEAELEHEMQLYLKEL
ncbi:MAG: hypothetical protein LBU51_07000 [Bacteroidales bacterium]|jgi:hypothetical protein|nr:hypothetical protein [Bacteroidales bacterium]